MARSAAGQIENGNGAANAKREPASFRLSPLAIAVAAALAVSSGDGRANPQGGVVQAGQARIQQTTANRLDIIQGSPRAAINWQSFSIGRTGHVNFQQPSPSAATLNRVVGANPSAIMGRLTANGQVFLINPNGVLFGQGAKIDVGSLVTSTANITNENFMAGLLKFDEVTNRAATIVNRGEITAAKGGLVALVAPGVENAGVIRAELGRVVLASGNAFTLDLYGDKLVRLVVDDQALDRLTDIDGRPLRSLVANSGRIEADGGQVLLATAAAKVVLDSAVNMSGVILARTFEQRPGEIVLAAGGGTTNVSGRLDASGRAEGERGGSVQVLGENIALTATSHIDASGAAGGGAVLVGGDWQGGGATARAANTTVEPGSRINADAITSGDGGKVVVWSDGTTQFAGAISARGGTQGGNGGNVEVSGKQALSFTGLVDAAAPKGRAGTLLLDPTDWIIGTPDADSFSRSLRQGTNVAIQADRDIEVNESIDGRGEIVGASLALTAGNEMRLNNDLLTENGAINLTAGPGGVQMGLGSRATNGQGAVVSAGTQPITVSSFGPVSAQHLFTSGAVHITTTGANANVILNRDLNGLANAPLGSLAITAGGAIQTKGLTAAGPATLSAGQGLEFAPSAKNSFTAGSVNATAAGDLGVTGDLLARSGAIDLRSTGGRITMGPGGINGTSTLSADGGGNVSLTSAQALTVGHVLTSGSLRLESTADTVTLTQPLLGAANTNGIGPLTLRTGGDLTLLQPIKSTGGVDIQAGSGAGGSFRDLRVNLGTASRIAANAGAGTASPIVLTGREVTLETGEVHSNGGDITINPASVVPTPTAGRVRMMADAGLFAGTGNISIRSAGRTDLTKLSLSGNLDVTATNGAIYLDRDLGGDLVVGTTSTPQPIGSVTLKAGGTDTFKRTYYGGPFPFVTGNFTGPFVTIPGTFAVRVRGIKSNGAVTIDGQTTTGEILLDGIIDAKGNVSLLAPAIRARHSVFADGGNITVGGRLILEPWGDEIVVYVGGGVAEDPPDPRPVGTVLATFPTSHYPMQWTDASGDKSAPGSNLRDKPGISFGSTNAGTPDERLFVADAASSQITLRATRVSGTGGQIALFNGVELEPDIRIREPSDLNLAAMRTDQQHVRLVRYIFEIPKVGAAVDRSTLPLVPLNEIQLNLQAEKVVFHAGPAEAAGRTFKFSGVDPGTVVSPFNDPVGRLSLLDAAGNPVPGRDEAGNPVPGPLTAVGGNLVVKDAEGNVVSGPFSGTWTSYNNERAQFGVGVAAALPGLRLIPEAATPSGTPAPPSPTKVESGYGIPELIVGQPSAGSGTAVPSAGVGGSLDLGSVRSIPDSGSGGAGGGGGSSGSGGAEGGGGSSGSGGVGGGGGSSGSGGGGGGGGSSDSGGTTGAGGSSDLPPVSPSDEYRRFELARYEADPLYEQGRGPSRVADLGREAGTRGSAADPFLPYWRVTRSPATGADPDYFGLSLFDYLERARQRSVP